MLFRLARRICADFYGYCKPLHVLQAVSRRERRDQMSAHRPQSELEAVSKPKDGENDRVTVAVRLRPWINHLAGGVVKADRSRSVLRINHETVEVVDPRNGASRGRYTFDKCFDSFCPDDPQHAPQEAIFDELAPPLVR